MKSDKLLISLKIKNQRMVIVTHVLSLTGLGIGELLALREHDVDFKNNKIEVSGSYDCKRGLRRSN